MFDRLLSIARLAAWASTGITIMYIAADALHIAIPHEGAIWVLTGVSWTLFAEMKSRDAMCDKVNTSVAKLETAMNKRMDDYERHTLGHTLAAERTLGCQPRPTDS